MKLINQSIKYGISLAYISLLVDIADLLENPLMNSISELDPELSIIIQDIFLNFIKFSRTM